MQKETGMAGWQITVTTQTPEEWNRNHDRDTILATWTTGASGIRPFEELLKTGDTVLLRSDGYPRIYSANARHILPAVRAVPDMASAAIVKAWYVTMHPSVIDTCPPDQRLTIVAWDQS
ncbi:hypothetical protein D9599_15485 [Roseomonas sp. KE2513]|uniref:hypothetical protein n=1 Tax=Roseomonas sp. KE2513 TaxID=2479202 RepID=UPI0018DF9576|nr:hypothetical protein [Roseomonas sp. KE2513]MBI0536972.1 hypothetical protein [Roseomonas sp. KE2513]